LPLVSVVANKVGVGIMQATREPLDVNVGGCIYTVQFNANDTIYIPKEHMAGFTSAISALAGGTVTTRPE
jgi:hypothetical protein